MKKLIFAILGLFAAGNAFAICGGRITTVQFDSDRNTFNNNLLSAKHGIGDGQSDWRKGGYAWIDCGNTTGYGNVTAGGCDNGTVLQITGGDKAGVYKCLNDAWSSSSDVATYRYDPTTGFSPVTVTPVAGRGAPNPCDVTPSIEYDALKLISKGNERYWDTEDTESLSLCNDSSKDRYKWDTALLNGTVNINEYIAAFRSNGSWVAGFIPVDPQKHQSQRVDVGGGSGPNNTGSVVGNDAAILSAYHKIVGSPDGTTKGIQAGFDLSGWTGQTGGFNWLRLGIDAAGGAVVATGAGLLTNTLIKNSQLKSGYESVMCAFGAGGTAVYGETFVVR